MHLEACKISEACGVCFLTEKIKLTDLDGTTEPTSLGGCGITAGGLAEWLMESSAQKLRSVRWAPPGAAGSVKA